MNEVVFLGYTQAELDRNFDQRAWAPNAEQVIARCTDLSHATRARVPHRSSIPYGPHPQEMLDVFPAAAGHATQIFVHGGRWLSFTKEDYSFVADAFLPAAMHTVVLNFAKLPAVRLPDMVEQVRRGVEWVYRNARSFGGDPDALYLLGHSSGAHLAALALLTDWQARGMPPDAIKAATCVSGAYDLEPVMLSARSAYIRLGPQEVHALSPQRHAAHVSCPVLLACAGGDTDEFKRQSREFAAALRAAGRLAGLLCVERLNHFEIMQSLGDPAGEVIAAARALVR
jgi:arylformamidase